MFRSTKVPIIALLVAVAFTCYLFGPARFRTERIAVRAPSQLGQVPVRAAGLGQPMLRFERTGQREQNRRDPGVPASSPPRERPAETVDGRYSGVLDDLRELVKMAQWKRAHRQTPDAEVQSIRADQQRLGALEAAVASSFQATGKELRDAGLPDVIQQRNLAAEVEFTARAAELSRLVTVLAAADDQRQLSARDAAVDQLAAFFDRHHQGPLAQKLDPKKLPFHAPAMAVREPATSPEGFPASLRAAAKSSSLVAQAPQGDPNLAATEDVQLTQPIRDLAASLGNNPVQIFNWVRNNVAWLPTYGSVQGSAVTLASKRGNAFDTASLLIALYRAAGIPARYVYGTIEVPADRMSNWAGGIGAVAAQQLMGQGGVPSVLLASGGAIGAVRLEHVWVEAFVDFAPSRGAINKAPDTWVPMDPSFKQYDLIAPIDLRANVPSDVTAVSNDAAKTALVNHASLSVTGIDQGALDAWAEKLGEGIDFKYGGAPDATSFTGGKTIIADQSAVLSGSISNKIVTRGGTWSEIPDSLRHKVTMTLSSGSALEQALGGSDLSLQISLPRLAGRRLGVTYVPATPADAATLASFRANPNGGEMPVYLVQVQASVRIDDDEIARGPSSAMGTEQGWDVGLVDPTDPNVDTHDYRASAGDELVFGIDAQGISQDTIHQRFQARPSDTAAENLFTVANYYWGQYDTLAQSAATAKNGALQRLPSIGLFSAPLRVGYFFGIPRTGVYASRTMDVAHSIFATIDRGNADRGDLQRVIGLIGSLLEGRTFDGLFGRPVGAGVSAVQLLREANEQQIPIHLINADNYGTIAPLLQVPSDIAGAISDAVYAGKTVLISQRAPSHGHWSGFGYIVEDPATGSAAYLINGGLNGGSDDPCNPERPREPVRVPLLEILLIVLIIILIILLILLLPEIIAGIGAILGGLGELGPVMAAVLAALGLAAAPAAAAAATPLPGPGDSMVPPGDCTIGQHLALQAEVDEFCHGTPSCRRFVQCSTIEYVSNLWLQCALARSTINNTCFRGGNVGHRIAENQAYANLAECQCRMASCVPP